MAAITEIRGQADWRGSELAASPEWRIVLRDEDRSELLAAIGVADSFPLPGFGPVLTELARELTDGRGFGLLQGLPVDGLTERQCEIMAVGIASHVGRVMPQPNGEPFVHVRDQGVDPAAPTSRSHQHRGRLDFHSDPTDVVALLCTRPAASGGLSTVVSSVTVHNEIVREHPDLAEVLYEPWWRDHRTGDSFSASPVYSADGRGRLSANYGADYIKSAQRGAHVPRLTSRQLAAMAALDRLNNDPGLMLTMDLRPGDMQFLNNHVTMHSRTEYRDHPDPGLRRDLVRVWLDWLG